MSRITDSVKFLDLARDRYQTGLDADQIDRLEAEADNEFANASDLSKNQWDQIPLASRKENHRPVLQWNRIPTYVQQVVNDGRQNKPAIKISQGDKGEKATAEFFQTRIRQIEYESDADIAYDTARDQQVTSGRGFVRVRTDWKPGTFQQYLCIERIENQFSVVFDPAAKCYDRSDADWCFVSSNMSDDQFKRAYGEEKFKAFTDWSDGDSYVDGWVTYDKSLRLIRVCEYWEKKFKERVLCLLGSTGLPVWKDTFAEEEYIRLKANGNITAERTEQDASVCRYVIDGSQILEEGDWLGSTIPIVPFWGREAVVNGIRRTYSLIRNAKDPQRLVNLYVSNIAEQIAMMPKAPYEAPVGSIAQNHEKDWQDSGLTAKAILYYKAWDESGRELPRPSRVVSEPPIQALTIGLQQSIDAIKAAMGIYDASLGARSNETSGIAIERRKKSAEIVNFHFPDNESRSRKRIGEILIELIPKLDKPGSTVPTRSEEGKTELVPIGTPYKNPKGEMVTHNLTDGDYGVVVSTGPTQDSARAEERESLTALITGVPETFWIIGDRWIELSDAPGSEEDADRVRRAINMKTPGLIETPEYKQGIPPQAQQQMMAMQQELEVTKQFAQSLHEKLETKQPELDNAVKLKQMDIEFQREKLAVDNTTKVAVEEIKLGITSDLELLHHEIDLLKLAQGLNAEKQAQESDQQHAATMQDTQHAQALEQGEQGHAQSMEQQDQAQAGALEQGQQAADLAPKETK